MSEFNQFMQQYRLRTEQVLKTCLEQHPIPQQRLKDVMAYSLLNGGKRVRALLVFASALAVAETNTQTDLAAAAVEAIHAYSLIHDDLPAMDDDKLRRGKPTSHIAFDEASAILAGDALQSFAFELLSQPQTTLPAETQLEMLKRLGSASGSLGMVAGQAIDLAAVDKELSVEDLTRMHQLKTGALISVSVQLGALSTGMVSDQQLQSLTHYAQAIGLAFQVQDDILDVTGTTETLGKQQGADDALNKPTFVTLLGLAGAEKKTRELFDEALNALSSFDYRADNLRHLAGFIIKRQS